MRSLPKAWSLAHCLPCPRALRKSSSLFRTPLTTHAQKTPKCTSHASHRLSPSFQGQPNFPSHPISESRIIFDSVNLSTALRCQANNFTSISPSKCFQMLYSLLYLPPPSPTHKPLDNCACFLNDLTSIFLFFNPNCISSSNFF